MLTVFDCLELVKETFLIGETDKGDTVLLHPTVTSEKDNYILQEGEHWRPVKAWYYRWLDSGRGYCTDNEWIGPFKKKQDAFESAYTYYGTSDDTEPEQDKAWERYARNHRLKLRNPT
jgi:hypothetical protein